MLLTGFIGELCFFQWLQDRVFVFFNFLNNLTCLWDADEDGYDNSKVF